MVDICLPFSQHKVNNQTLYKKIDALNNLSESMRTFHNITTPFAVASFYYIVVTDF